MNSNDQFSWYESELLRHALHSARLRIQDLKERNLELEQKLAAANTRIYANSFGASLASTLKPNQEELNRQLRNVILYGTSHPEMFESRSYLQKIADWFKLWFK